MSLGIMPCMAEESGSAGFEYRIENDEAIITGGLLYGVVQIPEKIEGYAVTGIDEFAFYKEGIFEIKIPRTVTSIKENAFYFCQHLEKIEVDTDNEYFCSVDGNLYTKDKTELIQYAICKQDKKFAVPETVTKIGGVAFAGAWMLEELIISESVEEIGQGAFAMLDIESIKIPAGVKKIGERIFYRCDELSELVVDEKNEYYKSVNHSLLTKDGKVFMVHAPGCNDCDVFTVPDGVETIEAHAFEYDYITDIILPEGVKTVSDYAFYGCEYIEEVNIPKTVEYIGERAFAYTGIREVNIPESVSYIGQSAFDSDSVESISVDAESKNYSSKNGVLFDKNGKTLIQYPASSNREVYFIPPSVSVIGENAFVDSGNLLKVFIPMTVTEIGNYAFMRCFYLNDLYVPDSVKIIGDGAFRNNESMKSIRLPAQVESWGENVLSYCTSLESVVLPEGIETVGDDVKGCYALKEITLPSTVNKIDNFAFENMNLFENVTIHGNVKTIGVQAYMWCENLKEVKLEEGVKVLEEGAFYCCGALESVSLPDRLESIGAEAFYYCDNLKSVTIPKNVSYIGDCSFLAQRLENIEVSEENEHYTVIDGALFTKDLSKMICYVSKNGATHFDVPDGVKEIAECAFNFNFTLESVVIPESVEYIHPDAFRYVLSLKNIYFEGSEDMWNEIGFNTHVDVTFNYGK